MKFTYLFGVRLGSVIPLSIVRECLSPLLLSMYINDLEEAFLLQDSKGIEMAMLKLF